MDLAERLPIVFTAQSKAFFYCRDAVCEYVFARGAAPVNPFRMFEYFLGDRVDRDLVRRGNNTLVRAADELWVFGREIADGVLFEILFAKNLGKTIRYFTIDSRAAEIREIAVRDLDFEAEVYRTTRFKGREEILEAILDVGGGGFPLEEFYGVGKEEGK